MAATVCPPPKFVGLDNSGNPLSSGKLYSYLAGTSTPAATYSDSDLTTPNANPIILDAGGRASVYLSATSYKFVLKSSADATIYTQDNVISSAPYNVDLDVPITAGEALTSGQAIYLSDGTGARTAGRWYLTDSDTAAYSTLPITGFVTTDVASGATGSVRLLGRATVPGALSVGSTYYLSGTPGALSTSAGTFAKVMGVADSATTLIMTVQQTVSSTGNLLVSGTLTVTGATALQSTLAVTGATTLSSTLASGALTVTGNETVSGTLGVTGAATLSSTVATGALTVTGNETVSGTLGVTGATSLSSTLEVTGATTLTGGLNTPLVVAQGGSGVATHTAYGVIVGGTTSTAATQTITPGTSGYLLTSGGASAVPTWAAAVTPTTLQAICDGRLTLTSGTPVTTADVTGATSIYFTPYSGSQISLYDGSTAWNTRTFTEITIAVGTLTSGLPYDLFAYDNATVVAFDAPVAWTNATTRATALTTQNGVLVKTGATTRRYIGTFYTTSTTQTEDSMAKRFLWNYYNRVPTPLRRLETTGTYTYTTNVVRQANGSTANQVAVIIGWPESNVNITLTHHSINSSADVARSAGIGEDSITAYTANAANGGGQGGNVVANTDYTHIVSLSTYPTVGYHYYSWLEFSSASGTTTWYVNVAATGGSNAIKCGIVGGIY